MEHAGLGLETLKMLVAASRGTGVVPMVRVPRGEYHFIARALDVGAHARREIAWGAILGQLEPVDVGLAGTRLRVRKYSCPTHAVREDVRRDVGDISGPIEIEVEFMFASGQK
jgi:hypothetical protein